MLFFCLMAVNSIVSAATITGTVKDKITREPIAGSTVVIMGTRLGASSDASGNYAISNVPIGKWKLKISFIGYQTDFTSVVVSKESEIVKCNIRLFSGHNQLGYLINNLVPPLEMKKIKKYQDSLTIISHNADLLTLTIDSLYCDRESMVVKLSFRNNTKLPVYVFKNFLFLQRLSASILSDKDTVKPMKIRICPTGEKLTYVPADLLLIPPGGSMIYPNSRLDFSACNLIPKGKFDIRIIYSYELPEGFSVLDRIPAKFEEIIPYLQAVRGKFISKNSWQLTN